MFNIFLARQPIFSLDREIYGYEILHRSGTANHYLARDPDQASSKVIVNAFQIIGLQNLTAGKPAFINFSGNLLKQGVATLFSKDQLVVELIESVRLDQEIITHCQVLNDAGYTIVLDDFIYSEEYQDLLDMVQIVKMDFLALDQEQIRAQVQQLENHDVILLAEKVETWEAFCFAQELGFKLFQGYFFSHPEILTSKNLTPDQLNYLALIEKLSTEEIDFRELAEIIVRDVSLTYSLLKLVNSAAFAKRQEIASVKQALVFLGEKEIRKWITLLALQQMNNSNIEEAITASLIRARFIQLLAEHTNHVDRKDELYIAGLFSMLDVLLQSPLPEILGELNLAPELFEMLVHGSGEFGSLWRFVLAYEQGNWDVVEIHGRLLGLEQKAITDAYITAVHWAS